MSGFPDGSVRHALMARMTAHSPAGFPLNETVTSQRPVFRMASLERSRHAGLPLNELLTPMEEDRASRFMRQDDRERFILGRFVLRSMMADIYGIEPYHCELETGPYGKPRLPNRPNIVFNIAHSGDRILVGMGCGMELGVDVEMHRNDVDYDGIGRLVFTASERKTIRNGPEDEHMSRFFRQWVIKEAVAKALGTGLALELCRFSIDQTASPAQVRFVGDGRDDVGANWIIADIEAGESYAAAMAWRRSI